MLTLGFFKNILKMLFKSVDCGLLQVAPPKNIQAGCEDELGSIGHRENKARTLDR